MWWMWIVGPILVSVIYVVTAGRDRRLEAAIKRFRQKLPSVLGAKKVMSLPGPLHRLVLAAGGGDPVERIELVPKLAYLASMAANAVCMSDHQTVVGRLEDKAPSFVVRPLPLIEGQRVANNGVEFKKDAEFMAVFLTESGAGQATAVGPTAPPSAEVSKKIRAFLSRPIRDALRDLPDAWLRVEEKSFALTIYGPNDEDKIHQLVTVADVIFAEYGADGGPSLLGDEGDEEEDDAAEEEDEPPPPPPPAKKSKPAKASGKSAPAKR